MISSDYATEHVKFCRRVAETTTIHLFNRFREIRYKDGCSADLKAMFLDDLRATEFSGLVLKDADFLKSCIENWVKALCISLGASPIRSNTVVILKRFFKRLCVVYNCSHTKGSTYDHARVLQTLEDCVYLRISGILNSRAKKATRTSSVAVRAPVPPKEPMEVIREEEMSTQPPVSILKREQTEPDRAPVRKKGREPRVQEEMKHRKPASASARGNSKTKPVSRQDATADEFVITLS